MSDHVPYWSFCGSHMRFFRDKNNVRLFLCICWFGGHRQALTDSSRFAFTHCICAGEHGHLCAYMYLSYLSPIGIFLPCQYCLRRPCIRSTVVTGHQPVVCSKGYEKTQSPHCPKYTPDQGCSSHLHNSDPKPPWLSVKSSAPRRCPLCCPVPSPCPKEKQSGTPCHSLAWWGSCGKEKPQ